MKRHRLPPEADMLFGADFHYALSQVTIVEWVWRSKTSVLVGNPMGSQTVAHTHDVMTYIAPRIVYVEGSQEVRERIEPVIPGSTIKGMTRCYAEALYREGLSKGLTVWRNMRIQKDIRLKSQFIQDCAKLYYQLAHSANMNNISSLFTRSCITERPGRKRCAVLDYLFGRAPQQNMPGVMGHLLFGDLEPAEEGYAVEVRARRFLPRPVNEESCSTRSSSSQAAGRGLEWGEYAAANSVWRGRLTIYGLHSISVREEGRVQVKPPEWFNDIEESPEGKACFASLYAVWALTLLRLAGVRSVADFVMGKRVEYSSALCPTIGRGKTTRSSQLCLDLESSRVSFYDTVGGHSVEGVRLADYVKALLGYVRETLEVLGI